MDARKHGKRQRLCMINTDMLWLSYNIEQRGYLNIEQMEVRYANGTMKKKCITLTNKHDVHYRGEYKVVRDWA